MRWALVVLALGFAGFVAGYEFGAVPAPVRAVVVYHYPAHALMVTESWTEQDFQALLQWERDGIFPRLGYDQKPPDWYVAEKARRGIVVKPGPTVTEEQFADPAFRGRYNR